MAGWKWINPLQKRQQEMGFWEGAKAQILASQYAAQNDQTDDSVIPAWNEGAQSHAAPAAPNLTAKDIGSGRGNWWDPVLAGLDTARHVATYQRDPSDDAPDENESVFEQLMRTSNTALESGQYSGGRPVDISGLPDAPYAPVQQAVRVATNPLTISSLGAAPASAGLQGLAELGGRETAVGTTGYVASEEADKHMPSWIPEDLRPLIVGGVGLSAGLGANAAIHAAPELPGAAARALTTEGGLLAGEVGGADYRETVKSRVMRKVDGKDSYSVNGMRVDKATYDSVKLGDPVPPQVPPANGESGIVPNRPQAAAAAPESTLTPPLPEEKGDSLARAAVTDTVAGKRQQGSLGDVLYKVPGMQRLAGFIDPSIGQNPKINAAKTAQRSVEASLNTKFAAETVPLAEEVERAMAKTPAEYHGPVDNKIAGSFKDIADHPDHYTIPPELRAALDDLAVGQEAARLHANGFYNTDIGKYVSGIPGAIYAGTVRTRESLQEKLAALGEARGGGVGGGTITKPRTYPGAYELMKADPTYQPETGVMNLNALQNQAVARAAAAETFKLGAGGLDKNAMMKITHPELVAARDVVMRKVEGLTGRLATQTTRAGVNAGLADELQKALEPIVNAVPDETRPGVTTLNPSNQLAELPKVAQDVRNTGSYADQLVADKYAQFIPDDMAKIGGLNTALRQAGSRVDVLLRRGELSGAQASSLKAALNAAQDQMEGIQKKWAGANSTRGTDYALSPDTFKYHPADEIHTLNEQARRATGGTKTFLDTMNELRHVHNNAHLTPLVTQGLMGFMQDPVTTVKTAIQVLAKGDPYAQLGQLARDEPEMVQLFAAKTGSPFGESGGEFNTGAGLGRVKAIEAVNHRMFAILQIQKYNLWKNDVSILQRLNPGMDLNTAATESANFVSKSMPSLNQSDRGLSPLRNSIERGGLTSPSYTLAPALLAKDLASGMVKLLASTAISPAERWQLLDGREQLALLRGGQLLGTIGALSTASAALAAPSRGMDPMDAMQEQFNPNNRYFASIQLGGGVALPLGGPVRSFVKAFAPPANGVPGQNLPNFLENKLNSPVQFPLRAFPQNEDSLHRKIRSGDFLSQLVQTAQYGLEQVLPGAAGAPLEAEKSGFSPLEGGIHAIGQALGADPQLPSPTEKLDQLARARGQESWDQASPQVRADIQKMNPDLYTQYQSRQSDASRAYAKVKAELVGQPTSAAGPATGQWASDERARAGLMTKRAWRDDFTNRTHEVMGAGMAIYPEGKHHVDNPSRWQDQYGNAIFDNMGADGKPDWAKVDAAILKLPAATQENIREQRGLGTTPMVTEYKRAQGEYAGLDDIPKYLGVAASDTAEVDRALADVNQATSKLSPVSVKLARLNQVEGLSPEQKRAAIAIIFGALKSMPAIYPSTVKPGTKVDARGRYKEQHPLIGEYFGAGDFAP